LEKASRTDVGGGLAIDHLNSGNYNALMKSESRAVVVLAAVHSGEAGEKEKAKLMSIPPQAPQLHATRTSSEHCSSHCLDEKQRETDGYWQIVEEYDRGERKSKIDEHRESLEEGRTTVPTTRLVCLGRGRALGKLVEAKLRFDSGVIVLGVLTSDVLPSAL
jgi:alkylhydroperoxidase family enzyme